VRRPPLSTMLSRALRLRCPRCGEGRLFYGYFRMPTHCTNCRLKYERDPGYFLGSAYINYGLTAVLLTALYLWLSFGLGYENRTLFAPLLTFVVVFPLLFFRYARALWLGMDCYLDRTGDHADDEHDDHRECGTA